MADPADTADSRHPKKNTALRTNPYSKTALLTFIARPCRTLRTDLKVLSITGYAENAVINPAHLEPGMQIMTKPFQMDALAVKIKEMIDISVEHTW